MQNTRIRSVRSVLFAASAFLAASSQAQMIGEGPYLYQDVGVDIVQDIGNNSLAGFPATVKLNPGFRLSIGPGYTLYSSPSFETAVQFETGFMYNSLDSLTGEGFDLPGEGEMYQIPFLVDLLYRFRVGPRFLPYFGVGGGGVYSKLTIDSLQGTPFNVSESHTDPAFQAMAGATYRLSDRSELGLGYKFLMTFPGSTDYIGTHTISLVYVLRF